MTARPPVSYAGAGGRDAVGAALAGVEQVAAAAGRRCGAGRARAAGPRSARWPAPARPGTAVDSAHERRVGRVDARPACPGPVSPARRPRSARSSPRSGEAGGPMDRKAFSGVYQPSRSSRCESPSRPPWSTASRISLRRSRSTSSAAFSGPLTLPARASAHVLAQVVSSQPRNVAAVGERPGRRTGGRAAPSPSGRAGADAERVEQRASALAVPAAAQVALGEARSPSAARPRAAQQRRRSRRSPPPWRSAATGRRGSRTGSPPAARARSAGDELGGQQQRGCAGRTRPSRCRRGRGTGTPRREPAYSRGSRPEGW